MVKRGEISMTMANTAPLVSNRASTDEKTDGIIGTIRIKLALVARDKFGNDRRRKNLMN